MNDEELKRIFSKNLNRYMTENDVNQKTIAEVCEVSTSTVSNWCKGLNIPRMDKIERLSVYFSVLKSDLIEEKPHTQEGEGLSSALAELERLAREAEPELLREIVAYMRFRMGEGPEH